MGRLQIPPGVHCGSGISQLHVPRSQQTVPGFHRVPADRGMCAGEGAGRHCTFLWQGSDDVPWRSLERNRALW